MATQFRPAGGRRSIASLAAPVPRRSLKPQLNQIRSWVQQGRTDAWIAHQLEVSVRDLAAFKREHELAPPEEDESGTVSAPETEVDLRAEDDVHVAPAMLVLGRERRPPANRVLLPHRCESALEDTAVHR